MRVVRWQKPATHDAQKRGGVGDRALRRRCQRIIGTLDIPDPPDMHHLCRHLGERRGRQIHLLPLRLPAVSPCGMWVSTGKFDAIFYEENTSPTHQDIIIGHEIGHLLCGHTTTSVIDADASRLLLPDLDPGLVDRVLGRTSYSAIEEREAETISTLLLRRVNQAATAPTDPILDCRQAELHERLRRSLEHPDR